MSRDDTPRNPTERAELLAALDREVRGNGAKSVLFSQAVAQQLGINPTDLECLDFVATRGEVTAGQLAQLTGLTTGAITGVIDRLEHAGYVRRERDPHDRRRVIVRPVPERVRMVEPLYESLAQAMAGIISRYTDQELAVIVDFHIRAGEVILEEIAKLGGSRQPRPS